MSPDERLEKYVQENNIIDIDVHEALILFPILMKTRNLKKNLIG
jgi:hypothetical protein